MAALLKASTAMTFMVVNEKSTSYGVGRVVGLVFVTAIIVLLLLAAIRWNRRRRGAQ